MADTFVKIATVTVGSGGASSIDFTSIPSTYTDLCLKVSGRSDQATVVLDSLILKFNGTTTSNSFRYLEGNGASASSGSTFGSGVYQFLNSAPAAGATSNTFSNVEVYIPNYTSSNNKSLSIDGVGENNATTAYADLVAGLWSNSSAITSIKLEMDGNNFVQYSTATLYGILKA